MRKIDSKADGKSLLSGNRTMGQILLIFEMSGIVEPKDIKLSPVLIYICFLTIVCPNRAVFFYLSESGDDFDVALGYLMFIHIFIVTI